MLKENIDTLEVEVGVNCLAVYTGRINIPLSELDGTDPNTEKGQKLIRKYLEDNINDINRVSEIEWLGDDEEEPLSGWCRVNPDTDKEIKFFIDY